ncbi:MAG TPA: T9SS type A sorting domain-containing protein, partial [Bacteroidota bacterium]|nr:T9SS type A sorting domain-containing protein [Bacteroidota bacterium]
VDTSGALANTVSGNSFASDRHGYLYMSVYFGNPVGSQTQGVLRKPLASGVWSLDTAGLPPGFTFFYQMAPDKNGIMYGHDYYSLMARTNTGWASVPGPGQIPGTYYTAFSFDSSNVLFAAMEEYNYTTGRSMGRGVYRTANQGASWTYAGLDSLAVKKLISYGDTTYAITDDGIFVLMASPATGVGRKSGSTPAVYVLFQNYPNPFNPTTAISYQLSAVSKVTLKVYDLLGREVATLVDGEVNAGKHEATFDASRLASGIYFYRLRAGNFTDTKKLVLLK